MSAMETLNYRGRLPPAPVHKPNPDRVPLSNKLNKLEFDLWMEHNVRNKYKVGDYVTFNYAPVNVGRSPTPMRISYIEEIHTLAQWNNFRQQAEVINTQMEYGGYQMRCPCEIRPLTEEELKYVDVLNLDKKFGSASKV